MGESVTSVPTVTYAGARLVLEASIGATRSASGQCRRRRPRGNLVAFARMDGRPCCPVDRPGQGVHRRLPSASPPTSGSG